MSETSTLTVSCPHCQHDLAKISVSSRTVVTVTCVRCDHVWCADVDAMTNAARVEAQIAILNREPQDFSGH